MDLRKGANRLVALIKDEMRADPSTGWSTSSGPNWAVLASLVETCKLNAVEPQAYLADVLTRLVNSHLNSRLDPLLSWTYVA